MCRSWILLQNGQGGLGTDIFENIGEVKHELIHNPYQAVFVSGKFIGKIEVLATQAAQSFQVFIRDIGSFDLLETIEERNPPGIQFITFHFPYPQIFDRISLYGIDDANIKSSFTKGMEKDFVVVPC